MKMICFRLKMKTHFKQLLSKEAIKDTTCNYEEHNSDK